MQVQLEVPDFKLKPEKTGNILADAAIRKTLHCAHLMYSQFRDICDVSSCDYCPIGKRKCVGMTNRIRKVVDELDEFFVDRGTGGDDENGD